MIRVLALVGLGVGSSNLQQLYDTFLIVGGIGGGGGSMSEASELRDRERGTSPHPVDLLIRDIIYDRKRAAAADIGSIVERMATAGFRTRRRDLSSGQIAAIDSEGLQVPKRGTELIHHWVRHVVQQKQWKPETTTAMDYLADGIATIRRAESDLMVQPGLNQDDIAIAIAKTADIVPAERLGAQAGERIVALYSARRGILQSIYMVDDSSIFTAVAGTIWLRGH